MRTVRGNGTPYPQELHEVDEQPLQALELLEEGEDGVDMYE